MIRSAVFTGLIAAGFSCPGVAHAAAGVTYDNGAGNIVLATTIWRIPPLGPNFCRVDYSDNSRVVTGWTTSGVPCDVLYPPGMDPPRPW